MQHLVTDLETAKKLKLPKEFESKLVWFWWEQTKEWKVREREFFESLFEFENSPEYHPAPILSEMLELEK
jgi:hypothetical protein